MASLTIGEVARSAGLNTSAIRFYERKGLLAEPERVGGQRRYDEEVLRRLSIIDVAKRAGFTLDDAKTLLDASDGGGPAHKALRELATSKISEVDALIARAQEVRAWLEASSACECSTLDDCSLFDDTESSHC